MITVASVTMIRAQNNIAIPAAILAIEILLASFSVGFRIMSSKVNILS